MQAEVSKDQLGSQSTEQDVAAPAFCDAKGPLPENSPYLVLQRELQSEHCCRISPGLSSFSVSPEHSKVEWGGGGIKTSVRKANNGKIPSYS